jgi:hypothetical protein
MRVRDHVLISAAAAAAAAPFIGRGVVALWAGGVLIDADHYVWFCLRQRCVNPVAALRFFNEANPPQHPGTRLLHSPVALVFVLLLGLRQRRLLPVALGMGLHAALDVQHVTRMNRARFVALARDGYSCKACGPATPAVTAHLQRQPLLLPSYRAQNLIALCGPCHESAHARSRGLSSWI